MSKDDSENWPSTNDPKDDDDDKYPPRPGCGDVVEQDVETGQYVCCCCGKDWEAWELLDNN